MMKSGLARWTLTAMFALMVPATAVHAGAWGDVARGFEAFGYRFSGQRNILGDGWNVNLNTVYTGQNYNFGFAQLQLGTPGVAVPSNISMGYTLRGIPSANFSWNTGGVPLPYTFTINNGFQEYTTFNGNFFADVSMDVNILGFYDTRVQISNRGLYETEGFFANDTGNLAYDIGPINISGNIYADILAAITQPFFAATNTENPFAKFSSRAVRTQSLDTTVAGLRARIEAGEVLTDEEMATLVNSALLSAIINGTNPGQSSLLKDLLPALPKDTSSDANLRVALVPEPASALLLMAGGALLIRRRRSF